MSIAKRAHKRRRESRAREARERPWFIAGTTTFILLMIGLIALAVACKRGTLSKEERDQLKEGRQGANDVARSILYGYDERSDLCFAYTYRTWGTSTLATGGPALDMLECTDKIRTLVHNPPAAWNQSFAAPPCTPATGPSQPAEAATAP